MRYIDQNVSLDLKKKMVFISGPRQCGKTTMVKEVVKDYQSLYLNWDDPDDRKRIMKRDWSDEDKVICFDEIHKYSRWKNFVKGTFDTQKEKHKFIVTGSARLDIYKKGQDSMLGRFFSWRLHPLCLSELKHTFKLDSKDHLSKLLSIGGFPEPYFSNNLSFAKRWRQERKNLIFRQDIQELEKIRDLSLLEFFYEELTERATGEIVLSNIARDLEIAPKTAKAWLSVLERTYALFTILPYSKNMTKSILKTPKVYFYDNGEVKDEPGARFENLVATHLLKKIHYLEDSTGDRYELRYLRDKNGHEVDFIIIKNRKPIMLIEAKVSETVRSKSLYYYSTKLKVEKCVQLVLNLDKGSTRDNILVTPAHEWLSRDLAENF